MNNLLQKLNHQIRSYLEQQLPPKLIPITRIETDPPDRPSIFSIVCESLDEMLEPRILNVSTRSLLRFYISSRYSSLNELSDSITQLCQSIQSEQVIEINNYSLNKVNESHVLSVFLTSTNDDPFYLTLHNLKDTLIDTIYYLDHCKPTRYSYCLRISTDLLDNVYTTMETLTQALNTHYEQTI